MRARIPHLTFLSLISLAGFFLNKYLESLDKRGYLESAVATAFSGMAFSEQSKGSTALGLRNHTIASVRELQL